MQKIITATGIFLILTTLLGLMVHAENNKTLSDLVSDPNYTDLLMKAKDIKLDEKTNTITFKNSMDLKEGEKFDDNTYLIDQNTIMPQYIPEGVPDLDWFLDGRAQWINIVIPESQYWKTSERHGEIIHVAGVIAFATNVVGINNIGQSDFERLEKLNIMTRNENGSFGPFDYITRAEMAKVVCAARNLNDVGALPSFSDIEATHWAYHAVGTAEKLGIMKGYDNNIFAPEENITYEQVVTVIVRLLGYEPLAITKGGYPNGYIQVAHEIGLLENLNVIPTNLASRLDVAKLMSRALDIPLMRQIGYGETPEYAIFNGVEQPLMTIMDTYFQE